ncbi:ATP-grasp domain-containing protein [Kutzneria sp. NPDC052558]|uniref:ATP-grasp domain-containing protein n=1 Tax=Kutzneria sp. NPDC052558 TaxID=3364121 RepID=UPI0037C7E070
MTLIVPADPLRPRRPDEHFAPEAAAARAAGVPVVLVDHDRLARGDAAELADVEDGVYRGWMLRAEHYPSLPGLRTSAAQYRQAHELPGWYDVLASVTPESVWTKGFSRDDFDHARLELGPGPAVLRDYTKSMKHYWHEAAYIPDLADADAAWAVAARFVQLRDDDLTGGFVLRRFEDFVAPELRTWWVDGTCRAIGPHPDLPADTVVPQPDPTDIAPLVGKLGLPFVTVDVVRRADGVWRVVELGDGQVSDRPAAVSPERMIEMLFPRSSGS